MPPMADRAAKRPKLATRGEDGYMPGNIIEIELRNFMTYGYLVCRPAPRLNLVIGPNGSGKSSIVCAIALGLAGEPQLLGRASNVGAYVQRGEDSGSVRIMLRGDTYEERINITRRIDTHNKSDWTVNGKPAAKRDVIEVIKRFNIQVSNLTQFLPQDRVCEFAKLTPIQLLEETEKAVGNPKIPLQHRALVEKSIELKKLEVTVKQNGETLSNLKALNAELEKDVERVRQRDKLLEKVELMKKKLPWLKYDMKKVEYIQFKEQETVAMKNLEEEATILNGLRKPIEMKKKEKAVEDSVRKKLMNLMQKNVQKRTKILDDDNGLSIQLRGKYREVDELKRQEDSRQERLAKAKEDLSAAEKDLENLAPSKHSKNEIEKLVSQISELQVAEKEKRLEKLEHERLLEHKKLCLRQCLDRLKDMENANSKLLSALKSSGTEKIFEAYEWLLQHKHEFSKEVYGPVLLAVKVPNREYAAYLEGHVPYYIWKSVITQDSTDRDLLVKSLGAYDVPVLNYVPDRNQNRKPFYISEEMRRLDICTRLDQIFDAPHAVKEVLISQAGLDNSYIGSAETDKKADESPQLRIQDLWTPENHYKWARSGYGGHVSAVVEPVSSSRLFTTIQRRKKLESIEKKDDVHSNTKRFMDEAAELNTKQFKLFIEVKKLLDEVVSLKWSYAERHFSIIEIEDTVRR